MTSFSWTAASGALCPRHPEVAATGTCPRCGSFLCTECTGAGAHTLCPSCRPAHAGAFPLSRERWTFSELWEVCAQRFKPQWVLLSVAALLVILGNYACSIPGVAVQLVLEAMEVESSVATLATLPLGVLGSLLSILLSAGFARLAFDALEGRPLRLGTLFSQLGRVGTFVVYGLVGALLLGLPLLVAFLPMILAETVIDSLATDTAAFMSLGLMVLLWVPLLLVLGMPVYLGSFALVYEPGMRPVAAIRHAWRLLSGHQLRSAGVLLVASLVMMGGMMLCCVGMFPGLAFFQLLVAGLYLSLRPRDGGRLA